MFFFEKKNKKLKTDKETLQTICLKIPMEKFEKKGK